MPYVSKAQARFFRAAEAAGELPKGTASRWAHHTKNMKKLPEHVRDKKAFVAAFLVKCAREGKSSLEQVAEAAEKLASELEKRAEGGFTDAVGRLGGLGLLGAATGLAIPYGAGYVGGRLAGGAKNQMDTDDAESLRISALANAYRRRAAEAKLNSQVRDFAASDPSKYVVIG